MQRQTEADPAHGMIVVHEAEVLTNLNKIQHTHACTPRYWSSIPESMLTLLILHLNGECLRGHARYVITQLPSQPKLQQDDGNFSFALYGWRYFDGSFC